MASPKLEVVAFYDSAGNPLIGLTPTFSSYLDSSGNAVSPPAISALGGGMYHFTPVFVDPTKGIAYIIYGGATAFPPYAFRYMRPEDWVTDNLPSDPADQSLLVAATDAIYNRLGAPAGASVSADVAAVLGEAQGANAAAQAAETSSGTAATQATAAAAISADLRKIAIGRWKIQGTQLILFELDGTTPYKTFDLKDELGVASAVRIFERVPV